jgi:hypothetical protein
VVESGGTIRLQYSVRLVVVYCFSYSGDVMFEPRLQRPLFIADPSEVIVYYLIPFDATLPFLLIRRP